MSDIEGQYPGAPRLRAADHERQQAIEVLNQAWRQGRIDRDDFQQRSQNCLTATYTDELDDLLLDVGGLTNQLSISPPISGTVEVYDTTTGAVSVQDSWQADRDELLPVPLAPEGTTGSAISVGIMSGMDKVGQWVVAPHHVSIGLMGGTTLDLRNAVFVSAETTITCIGIMGGVEVIVPPEMDVRVTGVGFMGGFGWEKLRYAEPTQPASPDNPRVTINGLGFWGGVGVVRKPRGVPYDD